MDDIPKDICIMILKDTNVAARLVCKRFYRLYALDDYQKHRMRISYILYDPSNIKHKRISGIPSITSITTESIPDTIPKNNLTGLSHSRLHSVLNTQKMGIPVLSDITVKTDLSSYLTQTIPVGGYCEGPEYRFIADEGLVRIYDKQQRKNIEFTIKGELLSSYHRAVSVFSINHEINRALRNMYVFFRPGSPKNKWIEKFQGHTAINDRMNFGGFYFINGYIIDSRKGMDIISTKYCRILYTPTGVYAGLKSSKGQYFELDMSSVFLK